MQKVNFEKNPVLPMGKLLSLELSRDVIWLQYLIRGGEWYPEIQGLGNFCSDLEIWRRFE